MGHEAVICKYKSQNQEAKAHVVGNEEEDQIVVARCFATKSSFEA